VFIVPTRALVEQTVRELRTQLPGVSVGVLYADEKRLVDHGVNVTTYASLHLAVARQAVPDPIRRSALAFVDEAHHAMTPRRVEALDDALDPSAVRVALTATPDYDSDRRLCRFFPDLIHEVELAEALRLGLLAPVRVWVAEVDADGSRVRLMAGDYEREALGCLMASAPFFRAVELLRYRESHAPLPCLIACSSRQQAHDLWRYLQRHRPEDSPAPGLVLGETPGQRRKRLLADFERGRLDTLIQVGVLIEGWSSPRCKLLIDLAPSMSRVRATQKYFRVMTRHGDQEARICVVPGSQVPVETEPAAVGPLEDVRPERLVVRGLQPCQDPLLDGVVEGDHELAHGSAVEGGGGIQPSHPLDDLERRPPLPLPHRPRAGTPPACSGQARGDAAVGVRSERSPGPGVGVGRAGRLPRPRPAGARTWLTSTSGRPTCSWRC